MADRKLKQDFYIRVCRDSGFTMDWAKAAQLTAGALSVSALEIGHAFPYLQVMQEIASGTHPVCKKLETLKEN